MLTETLRDTEKQSKTTGQWTEIQTEKKTKRGGDSERVFFSLWNKASLFFSSEGMELKFQSNI